MQQVALPKIARGANPIPVISEKCSIICGFLEFDRSNMVNTPIKKMDEIAFSQVAWFPGRAAAIMGVNNSRKPKINGRKSENAYECTILAGWRLVCPT